MATQQHQLVRREVLGSESIYRVVVEHRELVEVEVVSVPGLEPGMRVKLTRQAVEAMERLDQVTPKPVPPVNFSTAPGVR